MVFLWMVLTLLVDVAASSAPASQQNSSCNVYHVQSLRMPPACCLGNASTGNDLTNKVATLQVQMERLQSQVPVMQVKINNLEKQVALIGGSRLPGTCDEALINGSRYRVEDRQLSASSVSTNSSPARSRLHTKKGPEQMYGAWRPVTKSLQWIEVDFERQMHVTAIGTQGADQLSEWVSQYIIRYGDDGVLWKSYVKDDGRYAQEYTGNTDAYTVLKHRITFTARFVRLMPRRYSRYPALRWEIYGCPS